MSYHSQHMKYLLTGVVRGGIEKISLEDVTTKPLAEVIKPDPQLPGNTKWTDLAVLRVYVESGCSISAAAKILGTSYGNLALRLERVNLRDFDKVYNLFNKGKNKKKKTFNAYENATSLKNQSGGITGPGFWKAFTFIYAGDKKRTMKGLGITEDVFRYWKKELQL